DLPGSTPTRQLIVNRALEYLNSLAQEADDPSLLRELASAYVKVGNVQGNPNNSNLGDTAGALQSFQKAKRITDRLLEKDSHDAQAQRQLGVIEEKMCDVQSAMGDMPAAVANAQRSLAAFKSIAEANPNDVAAQQSLAISYFKTGDVLGNPNFPNSGDTAGALKHYEAALALLQSLPPATPDDYKTRRLTGLLQERIGTMLEEAGKIEDAESHYRESQTIRLELAEQHPENTDVVRDAAIAYEKMANVQTAAGHLDAALESRQRSLEIFTRLAEADPKNVLAQQSLGISYMHLADLLGTLGRRAEAIANDQRARDILSKSTESSESKIGALLRAIQQHLDKLQSAER
ncbi:MAG: tetratricopeptide repeat protein, partial [Chthoniobacterales bacterium]